MAVVGERADTVTHITSRPGCVDFTERGLVFEPATRAAVRAALGEPLFADAQAAGAAGQDSVFRLHWQGLQVGFHQAAGGGEVVDEVRVSDNRYLRYPSVGIGAHADTVTAALGSGVLTGDSLIYACHSHPARDDPVTFVLREGRVSDVVFTYWMD